MGLFAKVLKFKDYVRYYVELKRFNYPSPFEKRDILQKFIKEHGLDVFIETGTYLGNTTAAIAPLVKSVISIEIDQALANAAKQRFKTSKKIKIIQGDSAEVLKTVLADLKKPALFWLDGHFSSGITGGNPLDAPILTELKLILNHPIKDHVILIDDARLFVGKNGYPRLVHVSNLVDKSGGGQLMNVFADIIRIYRTEFSAGFLKAAGKN
jgi:hypothetical protein